MALDMDELFGNKPITLCARCGSSVATPACQKGTCRKRNWKHG